MYSDRSSLKRLVCYSMDFDEAASSIITLIIAMFSSFVRLIFWPYKTMRTLRVRGKIINLFPLYILCGAYFLLTAFIRGFVPSLIGAMIAYVEYTASIVFFSILPSKDTFMKRFNAYIKTWTYTLFPTLLWFYANLLLYYILPPPRTMSIFGKSFSIIFLAFSISLGIWKLILIYLSIRFSSRVQLPRIIYYFLLYLVVFMPFWILLYKLGVSRIPFV